MQIGPSAVEEVVRYAVGDKDQLLAIAIALAVEAYLGRSIGEGQVGPVQPGRPLGTARALVRVIVLLIGVQDGLGKSDRIARTVSQLCGKRQAAGAPWLYQTTVT